MHKSGIGSMGYFGYGNAGDEAILACLVGRLRALGVADRLIIFTAEPEATAALHGVRAVHGIYAPSPSAYLRGFLGRNRQQFVSTLNAFRSCDTIIIGGGGLLHDRPSTARYLLELLAKVEWAIRLGKRVIVLGVGIGPLHLAPSRVRLRDVLNKVELISVRDADSRALLEEIGVTRPEIHTTADFAFLLEPASTTRTDELCRLEQLHPSNGPQIAVCIRGSDTNAPTFRKGIIALCTHAMEAHSANLLFVPMQVGGGVDDRPGAESVVAELRARGPVRLLERRLNPGELMSLLGRMDLIVSEKLHGLIFAINTKTPFVGISYQTKVESLFREIGHPEWCVPLALAKPESLINCFQNVWSQRESIRAELAAIHEEQSGRATQNFEILARALQSF